MVANDDVPNKLAVIPPDKSLNDPVISVSPIICNSVGKLLDNITDPVIRWFPTNTFDPVVANTVEFSPSNKSAFAAYDADVADCANVTDEVTILKLPLNDPLNDPVAVVGVLTNASI